MGDPNRQLARVSLLVLALAPSLAAQPSSFIRGDVQRDGQVTLLDVSALVDFRYLGGPAPPCMDAADTDDNGALDTAMLQDARFLLGWLLRSPTVTSLPPPFPSSGLDPTADGLGCALGGFEAPGPSGRRFTMRWELPAAVPRGARASGVLLGTTAEAIACYSVAVRIPKNLASGIELDLDGTIFPPALAAELETSPYVRFAVVPAADNNYHLVLGAVVLARPVGASFERAQLPLTQGGVNSVPILHISWDVPADAPRGAADFILPPAQEDFVVAGKLIHGLKNEYGVLDPDIPSGGSEITTIPPVSLLVDGEEFLRADANADRLVDLSDAVAMVDFLFLGGVGPPCLDRADANDDGVVDISDPSYTLNYLFLGKGPPPFPGPTTCGYDPSGDLFDPCTERYCP